jgi:AraC family transcriptional regulator, activator of mtrCDE
MFDEAEIFRELAPLLRVGPELKLICRYGAQWASKHEPEAAGWAPFHIVTFGACLLDVGNRVGILLKAGDSAVLPHGGPHTVRALPTAAGSTSVFRVHRRLYDELVVKSNVDGEPDTKLICGRLCFEQAHNNMVLAALPPVVVLASTEGPDQARARRIVDAIRDELEEDRLGAAAIAAALASSLMIMVLTVYFENESETEGILALLARRQTARALAAILTELARSWTLEELAERANTSRSTLVRLFQAAVKMAPLAFLSELRFTLARHRILATNTPLAVIAENVGYQSEAAFSRAYHRRFGIAPGADRKREVGAPAAYATPPSAHRAGTE